MKHLATCPTRNAQVKHWGSIPYRPWWWPFRLRWRMICLDCGAK